MVDAARFWRHVMLLDDGPDTCWIWVGAFAAGGWGRLRLDKRREIRAHWVAYELQHGRAPMPGHRLLHTCNHPQCVRHWKQGGPVRRLSEQAVAAIRVSRMSAVKLARQYQISRRQVQRILALSRECTDAQG